MFVQFSPNFRLEFALPPEIESLREAPEGLEMLWQQLSPGAFAAAEVKVVNTGEPTKGLDPPLLLSPDLPAPLPALWAVWRPDFLTIITQHPCPRGRGGTPAGIIGGFASHMLGTDAGREQPRWQYNDRALTYSDWVYRQLFDYITGPGFPI